MKTRRASPALTITIPSFLYTFSDELSRRLPDSQAFTRSIARLKMRLPKLQWKKFMPVLLLFVVVVAIVFASGNKIYSTFAKPDERISLQNALAIMPVNKEISIPVKNAKGTELTKLKYFIETAELRNEIIVKGKRAVAIKGRQFLILTVKIVSDFDKPIELSARDYVRLSVNGNETELLAADIHNDPVSIQPISTKYSRIGFPINETDKNLTLFFGEIKNTKDKVALTLH